jgi:hypothetical protein
MYLAPTVVWNMDTGRYLFKNFTHETVIYKQNQTNELVVTYFPLNDVVSIYSRVGDGAGTGATGQNLNFYPEPHTNDAVPQP